MAYVPFPPMLRGWLGRSRLPAAATRGARSRRRGAKSLRQHVPPTGTSVRRQVLFVLAAAAALTAVAAITTGLPATHF